MGLEAGDRVMVHSSLSSMGHVEGGAAMVVQAFLDVLGPEGTRMVPTFTHSGCEYFDPLKSPSLNGAVGSRPAVPRGGTEPPPDPRGDRYRSRRGEPGRGRPEPRRPRQGLRPEPPDQEGGLRLPPRGGSHLELEDPHRRGLRRRRSPRDDLTGEAEGRDPEPSRARGDGGNPDGDDGLHGCLRAHGRRGVARARADRRRNDRQGKLPTDEGGGAAGGDGRDSGIGLRSSRPTRSPAMGSRPLNRG